MPNKNAGPATYRQVERISRQLDLLLKLLPALIATPDIQKTSASAQVALLHKRGFRNKELATVFGMSRQSVNRAIQSKKRKKR